MCLNGDVPKPASAGGRDGQEREGTAVLGSHRVIMLIETMACKASGRTRQTSSRGTPVLWYCLELML